VQNYKDHLILCGSSVKQALAKLNVLAQDAILFVVDIEGILIGSLTDGDIRRGLLNDFTIESKIDNIIQESPRYIRKGENDVLKIIKYRKDNFRILPVIDCNSKVVNVINFRILKSYLPIDAIIMAGGKGQRLLPLTKEIPKPMLKVGNKPIMEHSLDRLVSFGIEHFWVSINYLGNQIEEYFSDGSEKNVNIKYIKENEPLGTIGSVSNVSDFKHDYVIVTNSDLLSNIDYEDFFLDFVNQEADFAVLTIPYKVSIPYAVIETYGSVIKSIKEKPTYTFYSNGGIYLMKKEILKHIPKNSFFNSTDLMEFLIENKYKVISYPFLGYWLDVGKHDDYEKAQEDVKIIKF